MTPAGLAALYARAAPGASGWSAANFKGVLDSPGAFLCTQTHAFALGRVAADEAELILIATDPRHRRQGQATECMEAFEARAKALGATRAFLEVAESNAPARTLYARCGYAEIGRRKGYYARNDGTREDAILLAHDLT